jgi:type II secretory pathway pseudopilin PulG
MRFVCGIAVAQCQDVMKISQKLSMGKWSAERGMSLVEATIILMVLATLTAVIAPSMGDYVNDAEAVKGKEDVEVIGMGIARLLRDSGLPCVSLSGSLCTKVEKVELLVSGADETTNLPASAAAAFATNVNFASAAALNWAGATTSALSGTPVALMDPHLVTNTITGGSLTAAYAGASYTSGGGPRASLGWRGSYLNGPMGLDPWGHGYQANTIFAGVATNATAGTGEGALSGGWGSDMLVISAGPNGAIETLFGNAAAAGATVVGDDVVYVIQGSTR